MTLVAEPYDRKQREAQPAKQQYPKCHGSAKVVNQQQPCDQTTKYIPQNIRSLQYPNPFADQIWFELNTSLEQAKGDTHQDRWNAVQKDR